MPKEHFPEEKGKLKERVNRIAGGTLHMNPVRA
jgi:hypothetical protein